MLHSKLPFKDRLSFLKKGMAVHLFPHDNAQRDTCSAELVEEQRRLFGYNLGIEYQYGCDRHYAKTPRRAILYLHPWGLIGVPHKRSADLLKFYNVLPGDVIVFNFPDGGWRAPFPFVHTSFGQLSDVLPAIYTLAYAYDRYKLEAVDLFGYSRGGAVAINMIAVLNDKKGRYDKNLEYIGIDTEKRKQLLQLIQRGSLVLNCPLVDANATFSMYSDLIRTFFFRFTRYDAQGLQALQSTNELHDVPLKTLLHFQFNDQRVFNIKDIELYRIFKTHNPETTYLVLGNDGGHSHTQGALSRTIHTFYKIVGGAYDPTLVYDETVQSEHNGQLLQPSLQNAAQVIQDFYRHCAVKGKTEKRASNS